MATCSKCGSEQAEGASFCEGCGAPLVEGVKREVDKPRSRLGSLATEQHKKHIRSGRTAIMVVAILMVIGGIAVYFLGHAQLQRELDRVRVNPAMVVDEAAVAKIKTTLQMLLALNLLLAAVYLGLFFWAKTNPFGASLTALVLFITVHLVSAAIDPRTIVSGIIVKVVVIVVLLTAVRSGLAYRKLQEKSGGG